MAEKNIILQPNNMTATSVMVTPDKDQVIITYYIHEFTHMAKSDKEPSNSFQVRADLVPQTAISLSVIQANDLAQQRWTQP